MRRTLGDKWAANLAARQFFEREGDLQVPRKHIELVGEVPLKLGMWVASARARKAKLTPERADELTALGMRWTDVTRMEELHRSAIAPVT